MEKRSIMKKEVLNQNDRSLRSVTQKIGFAMLLFLGVFFILNMIAPLVSAFLRFLFRKGVLSYVLSEILYMLTYFLSFFIPTVVLIRVIGKESLPKIQGRQKMKQLTPFLVSGAIAVNFAAAYLNQFLVTTLLPNSQTSFTASAENWYQLLFSILSVAVVPAVCEELLFRGVVLKALIPYGRATAILTSAVLFGLMHGNPLQLFYTTLLGVVIGYLYVRTGSLFLCMLTHFVNNGISCLQEYWLSLSDRNLAVRLASGLEIFMICLGAVSIVFLMIKQRKRKAPEDEGSYGIIFEPSLDYEERPITKKRKLRLLLSPSMIAFLILSGASMLMMILDFFWR